MRRVAIALLLLSASCGSSEDSAPVGAEDSSAIDSAVTTDAREDDTAVALDSTTPPTDAMGDAIAFGPYPAGPYFNKLGDVVANLAWEGYVSPLADAIASTKPYVTTSMDLLRRDAKKGYALVHVSEFY